MLARVARKHPPNHTIPSYPKLVDFLRVTMKRWLWKAKSQIAVPEAKTNPGRWRRHRRQNQLGGFNHKKTLPNRVRKLIKGCWETDQRNKKAIFQSSRKQDPWPIFNFWWMAPRKLGKIGPPDGFFEWLPKDAFPLQEKDAAASLLDEQQTSTSSSVRIELEDLASDVWTLDTWQLLDHAAQFLHVCRLQFLEMDSRLPIIHQQLLKLTSILLLPPDPSWIFWTNTSLHVFFFSGCLFCVVRD